MSTISSRILRSVSEFDISGYFGLTQTRVNIANAAIFGLKEELGLVGNEYNIALVILFVQIS